MHIGENIMAIRERQGLSQKELAQRLKIRKKTLVTIEQMQNLTQVAIMRTSQALGVTAEDLMI